MKTIQSEQARTEKQVKIVAYVFFIAPLAIGALLYIGRTIIMYIQSHHI